MTTSHLEATSLSGRVAGGAASHQKGVEATIAQPRDYQDCSILSRGASVWILHTACTMHSPLLSSILHSDLAPAVVVVVVALIAALPAYLTLSRAKPGRARSAISYLLGFFAGVLATIALGRAFEPLARGETPIVVVGMLASLIGPFLGMVHAKLARPPRRRRPRSPDMQLGFTR
jgi:hypothetical protein